MERIFVGIDIQGKRGCCFAALQNDGTFVASGWFRDPAEEVVSLVNSLKPTCTVSVGIDGPRQPLPFPRKWYWNRRASTWTERTEQRGYGRHCEIMEASLASCLNEGNGPQGPSHGVRLWIDNESPNRKQVEKPVPKTVVDFYHSNKLYSLSRHYLSTV